MYKPTLGSMFRSQLSENIFSYKYAHTGCETWDRLAETVVDDVCSDKLGAGPSMSKEDRNQLTQYIKEGKFSLWGKGNVQACSNTSRWQGL
jgi:hypothetical protein